MQTNDSDPLVSMRECAQTSPEEQIDELATFIIENFPTEITFDGGAVDVAIHIMRKYGPKKSPSPMGYARFDIVIRDDGYPLWLMEQVDPDNGGWNCWSINGYCPRQWQHSFIERYAYTSVLSCAEQYLQEAYAEFKDKKL